MDHDVLCPACWRQIAFIRPPLCDRLGVPLSIDTGGKMLSAAAVAEPPDYDRARAVARFDGLMRVLIHGFKFHDSHNARRLFGRWLAEAGKELLAEADLIVPMPLARWRLLSRRFNQAQILAAEAGRRSDKPVNPFVLMRSRSTPHQIGLTKAQRMRNVAGVFRVPANELPKVSGKAIVLVDDVITSGATASAAAIALKRAGARRVDVLALAIVSEGYS
jgi:ComF family protein